MRHRISCLVTMLRDGLSRFWSCHSCRYASKSRLDFQILDSFSGLYIIELLTIFSHFLYEIVRFPINSIIHDMIAFLNDADCTYVKRAQSFRVAKMLNEL
jgi:hypothetical protein